MYCTFYEETNFLDDLNLICPRNNPTITTNIPKNVNHVSESPNIKYDSAAVKIGMRLANKLAFVMPTFLIP